MSGIKALEIGLVESKPTRYEAISVISVTCSEGESIALANLELVISRSDGASGLAAPPNPSTC